MKALNYRNGIILMINNSACTLSDILAGSHHSTLRRMARRALVSIQKNLLADCPATGSTPMDDELKHVTFANSAVLPIPIHENPQTYSEALLIMSNGDY